MVSSFDSSALCDHFGGVVPKSGFCQPRFSRRFARAHSQTFDLGALFAARMKEEVEAIKTVVSDWNSGGCGRREVLFSLKTAAGAGFGICRPRFIRQFAQVHSQTIDLEAQCAVHRVEEVKAIKTLVSEWNSDGCGWREVRCLFCRADNDANPSGIGVHSFVFICIHLV